MSTNPILRTAVLANLLLAAPLVGQRSWVVDAGNGPGTDFTDLPPAVAAAADLDILRVRAGSYTGSAIRKALRLLGEPGATIRSGAGGSPALTVSAIAAGAELVLRGFVIQGAAPTPFAPALVTISGCPGSVHLEDVTAEFPAAFPNANPVTPPALDVAGCAAVSLGRCRLRGGPGLRAVSSTIVATSCSAYGMSAGRIPMTSIPFAAYPALDLSGSTLLLAQATVQGGGGFSLGVPIAPPAPGIRMAAGRLVVAGDGSALLASGSPGAGPFNVSAVVGSGDILIDPAVRLQVAGTAAPFSGGTSVVTRRLPALTASGAAPGGVLTAELYSPSGHLAILFASRPAVPVETGLGQWWLDPGTLLLLDAGVQGASEHRVTSVPVPNDPALRGLTVAVQALSGPLPAPGLSTPAVVTLH